MGLREDVLDMKEEVNDLRRQSLAMELLKDYKKTNKRLLIIWIITFVAFIGLLGYTIYLSNDIGSYEQTITQENEDGYNNYIGNDGDITNGETNN